MYLCRHKNVQEGISAVGTGLQYTGILLEDNTRVRQSPVSRGVVEVRPMTGHRGHRAVSAIAVIFSARIGTMVLSALIRRQEPTLFTSACSGCSTFVEAADLVGEGRSDRIDPLAVIALALPFQGLMLIEL